MDKTNIVTTLLSIIIFLILLIIVVFILPYIPLEGLRIFLETLLSTVATVFLANGVWELIAKKRFSESLFEKVKMSENIVKSGIDSVYIDFHSINWREEFEKTDSFTAVFVYAYSWRQHNDNTIRAFAKKRKHRQRLRIIVPDPDNVEVMSEFDRRFRYSNGVTKQKVEKCIQYYYDLGASVFLFSGSLQASYYLMDKSGIMSFFSHSAVKGSVPAIRANKNGNMYNYLRKEVDAILSQSRKVKSIKNENNNGDNNLIIERESK